MRHPERDLANLGSITSLDGAKQRGPRWSTVGMMGRGISSNFAERDTSLELATFGLGRTRAIARIVRERGHFGQLKAVCLDMLIASATGDERRALAALTRMRDALVDALDVTAAIALAGELLVASEREREGAPATSAA